MPAGAAVKRESEKRKAWTAENRGDLSRKNSSPDRPTPEQSLEEFNDEERLK